MTKNMIKKTEKEIAKKRKKIIQAHNEGIETGELAEKIKSEYPIDYLKYMARKTMMHIDNMAINAKVNYAKDLEKFTVSFSEGSKGIEIKLVEVLDFKFVYQKSFFDSIKSILMYKLVYGEGVSALV